MHPKNVNNGRPNIELLIASQRAGILEPSTGRNLLNLCRFMTPGTTHLEDSRLSPDTSRLSVSVHLKWVYLESMPYGGQ